MTQQKNSLLEVGHFIAEYSSELMGSGVHTSRVIRNSKRIAESFDYRVTISVFQRSIILNIVDDATQESYNEVIEIRSLPISFKLNSELSALSWEAYDNHLSLNDLRAKYHEIISQPSHNPWLILMLVGVANASFCKLFGGDMISMAIVFLATTIGFHLKRRMTMAHLNNYIIFVITAFVASMCAASSIFFKTTSEIALATSVLFLVPGVPLINGVIDTMEGHILTGFSRLVNASLLIVCIAIGLSFTLLFVKNSLI